MTKNNNKPPIPNWTNDLTQMSQVLLADLQRVTSEIALNEADQYLRRTFVRTLFAMIEGCLNSIIRAVLFFYHAGVLSLDEAEIAQLSREIDVELENGSKNKLPFLKLLNKFKFSYGIYVRKLGGDRTYILEIPNEIEQNLQEAIELRHRLMHPKLHSDLSISDSELEKLKKVAFWYMNIHVSLTMYVAFKLNERNQKIQGFLDRNKEI